MTDTPLNPDGLRAAEELMIRTDRITKINYLDAERIITAYLTVAQPVVNSAEELDQLPVGTILRDSYGLALHKRTANWWVTNGDNNLTSEDLADEIADTAHTYTVLYRPTKESTNGR